MSWCRDTRVLIAFKEASGIELVLSVVENEEWKDLHVAALDLLISVVDSPELCDYFLHSGCLQRIVNLLYTVAGALFEKILAALARMSQHPPSRVVRKTILNLNCV